MTARAPHKQDQVAIRPPYHIRQRVLQALGTLCVLCGATKHLHIDHVFNDGKAHRQALGLMSLERWMCDYYDRLGMWPGGFQLLCRTCHQRKTLDHQRSKDVPARKGYQQHNISLPDALGEQVSAMAVIGEFNGSKSAVIEAALTAFFAGQVDKTLVENFHTHLATMEMTLHRAYKDIPVALEKLHDRIETLHRQQEESVKQSERRYTELVNAYDRLTGRQMPTRQGWFARLFR